VQSAVVQLDDDVPAEGFIQTAIRSPVVTNENRPLDEVRKSTDLFHDADHSQSDRNTEKIGQYNKEHEDTYEQGHHNTGMTNSPSNPKLPWNSVL